MRTQIDETGHIYGRLTVEYYNSEKRKWHCKCSCGNEVDVCGADLRRQHTQSCGCLNRERTSQKTLHDLTNQQFGKLKVLERDNNYRGHGCVTHWYCLCESCGQIKSISANSLHRGAMSCGCKKSKGELIIANLLSQYNIRYVQEYKFPNYPNRRYDFAIFNQQNEVVRLIEFDGIQHYYKPRANHWAAASSLEETQQRDKEKNQIAIQEGVPLIRIPYWKMNKITILNLLDDTFLVKE